MPAEALNPNAKTRRKPHRFRPKHDEVIAALRRSGCFLGPAAVQIGISRSNLQKMIRNNSRLAAAFKDLNESALDRVEGSLWDRAINGKDVRAQQIILNARARHRGYGLQPGEVLGDQPRINNFTIKFITPADVKAERAGKVIEHEAIEDNGPEDEPEAA